MKLVQKFRKNVETLTKMGKKFIDTFGVVEFDINIIVLFTSNCIFDVLFHILQTMTIGLCI